MKCFISKLKDISSECEGSECALWNNKRSQCAVASYCEAYLSMGLAALKMQNAVQRIESQHKDEWGELNGDDGY
jgi:hypothetical protein